MDINTEIPAPSTQEQSSTPIGYDIPRDTISRDFIRSAKTARQLYSQQSYDEGLRYLMPSPSSSSSRLVCESPRIVISSPDDDIPLPQSKHDLKSFPSSKGDPKKFEPVTTPSHYRSSSKVMVLVVVVVIIVVFLLILLVYA